MGIEMLTEKSIIQRNQFHFTFFILVIRGLVDNNNYSIANCIFYITKKM